MSDEALTAAMLANLVAGNLQHVDDNMVNRSSSGPAKKLNPAQFLPQQIIEADRAREHEQHRRVAEELNRQALMTHPHSNVEVHTSPMLPHSQKMLINTSGVSTDDITSLLKTFKSIDSSLKKIATHITSKK